MKRKFFFGFMCAVVFLICSLVHVVHAQSNESVQGAKVVVPRLIRFSGVVRQVGEKPARGVVELSFSLFKEEAGGEPLWFESQTVEVDAQGRYNVLLGAMHADGLPMDLFTSGEARWLSIMVGKVEQPRVLLVSVPYALKAGDAESLGGKPATAYVASDQLKSQVESSLADSKIGLRTLNTMVMASSGGSDTPPAVIAETSPATFTCTTAGNCVTVTQNGAGNTLFAAQTAVSGVVSAVRGETTSPSGRPVFGWAKSTTGSTFGVWGQSASADGAGVFGSATSATGQNFGLWGQSASVSGAGLYGLASAATGTTYGIFGSSSSASGAGIRAQALAATGNTMGVRAIVNSATGTAAVFDNLAGGKLISGRTAGLVEKFSVSGAGNVTGTQFVSTVTTGTPPLSVSSTTLVPNLNADTLDGFHASAFAALGSNLFVGDQGITGKLAAVGATTDHNSAIVHAIQNGSSDTEWSVGSYPAAAIRGDATTPSSFAFGVLGTAQTNDAAGVAGVNTEGIGVAGLSYGPNWGAGVVGWCEQNTQCTGVESFLRMEGTLFEGRVAADPTDDEGIKQFSVDKTGMLYAKRIAVNRETAMMMVDVNGGVRLNTTLGKPACNAATRGTFWVTLGDVAAADSVEVCTKDASETYAWRNLI